MTAAGLSPDRQARYKSLVDRIGNLELLNEEENKEKRAKPFDQWLLTRNSCFCHRHLIPTDNALLAFDRFEDFVIEREKLIVARLRTVIS